MYPVGHERFLSLVINEVPYKREWASIRPETTFPVLWSRKDPPACWAINIESLSLTRDREWPIWTVVALTRVMSIGNQEFGIPRKYQYQIGIWYLWLIFFCIFLVFYQNLEYDLVKSWFNIGIFGRLKIGLVFGFCGCHFIGIGLVSVCHFPENGIST